MSVKRLCLFALTKISSLPTSLPRLGTSFLHLCASSCRTSPARAVSVRRFAPALKFPPLLDPLLTFGCAMAMCWCICSIDYRTKIVDMEGKKVKLQIWDTGSFAPCLPSPLDFALLTCVSDSDLLFRVTYCFYMLVKRLVCRCEGGQERFKCVSLERVFPATCTCILPPMSDQSDSRPIFVHTGPSR